MYFPPKPPEARKLAAGMKHLEERLAAAVAARKAVCDSAGTLLAGVKARHGDAQVVRVSDFVKLLYEIGPNRIT